jgi:hypothetical protein
MPALHRLLKPLALAVGALLVGAVAWDVATYDREAWLADYARVKRDMAQGYANLDWMVEKRGIDLVALDRDTTAALSGAHSRVRAFIALRRFVHAFGDPHLRLKPGERPSAQPTTGAGAATSSLAATTEPADVPAGPDCEAAGYEEGGHAFGLPVDRLSGWKPLRDGDFPSGLAGETGVLRIAQFGEDRYLSACRQVFKPGVGQRELQLAVRARQQALLQDTIAELRAQGARRLLVDVTGNGGGSEWVSEVIALMTDRPMRREEARLVGAGCDRSAVWSGRKAPCSVYGGAAPEVSTLRGTGAWRGPLLIAADRGTGSAAEDFVVWLHQNGVAKVFGERTAGAGCGYVNGGTVTRLSVVPVDVMMPNCSRFLANGTNEVEGIRPDTPMALRDREPQEVAAALEAMLRRRP